MALVDFITTFNNTNKNVFVIDPLNTFSLVFQFSPSESKIKDRIQEVKFEDDNEFSEKLNKFVQRVNLPNFTVATDAQVDTVAHVAVSHKMFLNPEQQTFNMDVINTNVPILEEVFYPWLREVQYPEWNYASQPYTTADITVNMLSHSDIEYHLLKCRPTMIDTYNPSHELGAITRAVTFTFDLMYVRYAKNYSQSTLQNLAGKLVNKSLKTIGL